MITKEQICSICYDHLIPKWNSMPETFPDFLPCYTSEEQTANEAFLSSFMPELRSALQAYQQQPDMEQRKQIKKKLHEFIKQEHILHIQKHFSEELFADFEHNIELFLEKTNAFDETLPADAIWQAMRNYLIYCMIVNLQGENQNCRDTILGYSLLYPYTDTCIANFSPKNSQLHTFTLLNCQLIVLATVAKNANHFSKSYLTKIEKYLPFSISFFEKINTMS